MQYAHVYGTYRCSKDSYISCLFLPVFNAFDGQIWCSVAADN